MFVAYAARGSFQPRVLGLGVATRARRRRVPN